MAEQTDLPAAPPAPAPSGATVSDRVFGAIGVIAVVAALLFFVLGEEDTGAGGGVAPPPPVTVVEPRDGAVVSGAFALVFETPARMSRDAGGWVAEGRYHLHAIIDGVELMAGPADVQALGGARYRWTVPGLSPGEHRVRLQWSGPDHRGLEEGGSAPFTLRVR